jgi:acyl-ACP thioesterase
VIIEHESPVAGDKLEILAHVQLPGSTDPFGPALVDATVTTLTYTVDDQTRAIASIFALSQHTSPTRRRRPGTAG